MTQDPFDQPKGHPGDWQQETWPEPPKKSGCLRGCLIGCGAMLVLFIVAIGVVYYTVSNFIKESTRTDPVDVNGWLQAMVPCEIPNGLEPTFGVSGTILGVGGTVVILAPKGVDWQGDQSPDTLLMVVQPQGIAAEDLRQFAHQEHVNEQGMEEEKVVFDVGGQQVTGTKMLGESDRGEKMVVYNIELGANVFVFAFGDAEAFDLAALESLLKSMRVGGAPLAPEPAEKELDAADTGKKPEPAEADKSESNP